MAKVKNPITFAGLYKISPKTLNKLRVVNPTLDVDTKLFIDPLLLENSKHSEMHTARKQYIGYFETAVKLLARSQGYNDVPWRNARRLFEFEEIRGTCLGYSAASIFGNAFGPKLIERVMDTAKAIVNLGISDPDLFVAMALLEDDIGPDRISDMTTNVIIDSIISFNARILNILKKIPTEEFTILDRKCSLPRNPYQTRRIPIILVPDDIVRPLPIVTDWDEVCNIAAENDRLRNRVNRDIAEIWKTKAKRDKERLKEEALHSKTAFQTLLDVIHEVPHRPYNVQEDPEGLIKWAEVARIFSDEYPLKIKKPTTTNLDKALEIVKVIVNQFKQLIENNGLWKNLYHNGKPLKEKYAQRLFFAIAYAYCKANKLDVTPEADSGNGPVDFKFSGGFDSRVLVEVKLSTNRKLVHGYETQLEVYKESEETMRAIYLVIDLGMTQKKRNQLFKVSNEASGRGDPLSDIVFVDGSIKASASKRKSIKAKL